MNTSDFHIPQSVLSLCDTLNHSGFEAFLVGGCVRDQIMGITPADFDITTNCLPHETARIFSSKGLLVVPTGIRYGTVSVMVENVAYEITTYRSEQGYSDGRHPDNISFLGNLHADLERRDFTINAMAFDPLTARLVDTFGGLDDIEHKVLRAVGNPLQRFSEDYLRMLRAVRYASRFSYAIDPETLSAIKQSHSGILQISQERILNELLKMASQPGSKFADALILLKETGLLTDILPELDCLESYLWDATLSSLRLNTDHDPTLNLVILFHNVSGHSLSTNKPQSDIAVISRIARRMKMSNQLRDALCFTSIHHEFYAPTHQLSNHQFVHLMQHPCWELLYRTIFLYYSVYSNFDLSRWQPIETKIRTLYRYYFEEGNLEIIRKLINGDRVMTIKKCLPGPEIGIYIDATINWILDNSVDINETSDIDLFIGKL
jgi:tRNA nucleotidyltransferase (CCA-adding enzyme)